VLGQILYSAGASFKYQRCQVGQLFGFACRHSIAACIQQLQDLVPCMDYNACPKLQPWPQHLAMAAARVDPGSAGVVRHLLQSMSPKLLAAKYMGPEYTSAYRAGHMPVLQQLLQVAAAAPQQHLPATSVSGSNCWCLSRIWSAAATAPLEAAALHLGLWVLLVPAAATAAGRCRLLLLTALAAAAAAAGCCHSSPNGSQCCLLRLAHSSARHSQRTSSTLQCSRKPHSRTSPAHLQPATYRTCAGTFMSSALRPGLLSCTACWRVCKGMMVLRCLTWQFG